LLRDSIKSLRPLPRWGVGFSGSLGLGFGFGFAENNSCDPVAESNVSEKFDFSWQLKAKEPNTKLETKRENVTRIADIYVETLIFTATSFLNVYPESLRNSILFYRKKFTLKLCRFCQLITNYQIDSADPKQ
jgi:hypothetical protein